MPDEFVNAEKSNPETDMPEFKPPICLRCCGSADYHINVLRPGGATGRYKDLQEKESAAAQEEADDIRDNDADDDDATDRDGDADDDVPLSRVDLLADSHEDREIAQQIDQQDQHSDTRAALTAAMEEADAMADDDDDDEDD